MWSLSSKCCSCWATSCALQLLTSFLKVGDVQLPVLATQNPWQLIHRAAPLLHSCQNDTSQQLSFSSLLYFNSPALWTTCLLRYNFSCSSLQLGIWLWQFSVSNQATQGRGFPPCTNTCTCDMLKRHQRKLGSANVFLWSGHDLSLKLEAADVSQIKKAQQLGAQF